ncbi:MAG: hypothetical protein AUJ31_03125 [Parcubacteria group bacterium CG1_02_39_15]|uniref:Thioredoxin domain-containing protein n=4 Tax=Candidatus Nealsoniibacteriota TaxID=1817911 RepID=A0A2G9YUQ5_9BACT|nr:MAG: hypothetical protein AUJ31_03125 [Parcubacteria group bacterium CG1_02_39_15]PIP22221.1 MAG: hypothetical protein COX38_01810 [Candidatus Nealsonbacteria bacterium CG23_combo_of_CG06-09_8_20_14_all_39_25]PIQ98373.1 MAG: hypothetical protein COV64_01615 [Candidatus Nealsonbacteria bacterium CG11_big_fil_rev_8_21_14_0_20_39_9]PIW90386.1 MAG: hypothetical protein COZ92_00790 [Candidatus Nealsonbacteria bacterium CG_4_8_14_3_um_filter_40_11]PIZ88097.1 MAG: hypothetical protein COX91_02015 [
MKTKLTVFILITLIMVGTAVFFYFSSKPKTEEFTLKGECQINKMIFYYTDWCPWCAKVKDEGTISNLKKLGVEITEINVDKRTPEHQIRDIPAFVIGDSVYEGYKTFEQLSEMLNCQLL